MACFAELASSPQHEHDLAAETIYRFVFRSPYHVRALNGDPHPGNYLFHRRGRCWTGFPDTEAFAEFSLRSELLAWVPAAWRAVSCRIVMTCSCSLELDM